MSVSDTFEARLARALWLHKTSAEDIAFSDWSSLPRTDQMYWHFLALAALRGIREPTAEMCRSAEITDADVVWRRMVDAASGTDEFADNQTDPTRPFPPIQIEDAYRRGYQQGAQQMFDATERYIDEPHRKKLKSWLGEALFKWRYGFRGKGLSKPAPIPPYTDRS